MNLGPMMLVGALGTLETLENPFQNTFGNIKTSYSAQSNSMTLSHAVKTSFNRLFQKKQQVVFQRNLKRVLK